MCNIHGMTWFRNEKYIKVQNCLEVRRNGYNFAPVLLIKHSKMNKETEKLGLSPSRAAVSEAVSSPGILKRIKNVFNRYCQQLRTKNRRGHVIRFDGCYINLNISDDHRHEVFIKEWKREIFNEFLEEVENVNVNPNPTKD